MATPYRQQRRIPIRSCVVCRQTSDKRALLRVVRPPAKESDAGPAAPVIVDATGKRSGRGAYVCAEPACIDAAKKRRSFERALAVATGNVPDEIFVQLKAFCAENSHESTQQPG